MPTQEYYKPSGEFKGQSVRCSIANLLIELGDNTAAQKAYNSIPVHQLSTDGAIPIYFMGKVFREVTKNKYIGELTIFGDSEFTRDDFFEIGEISQDRAYDTYLKERDSGLLEIIERPKGGIKFPILCAPILIKKEAPEECGSPYSITFSCDDHGFFYINDGEVFRDSPFDHSATFGFLTPYMSSLIN